MKKTKESLRITEVFHSLQGESVKVGLPTVFVRLTGCPLRCQYCDTAYAFHGGKLIDIDDLVKEITSYHCKHICITGGEPLAQPGVFTLMTRLADENLAVSLETSGAMDVALVDQRVMIIMDLKTPDSGEDRKNLFENINHLKTNDQIKFVLCSRNDYDWACKIVDEHQLAERVEVLFSPSYQQLNATTLADWILKDRLKVRMQIQLHKLLWNDEPGR